MKKNFYFTMLLVLIAMLAFGDEPTYDYKVMEIYKVPDGVTIDIDGYMDPDAYGINPKGILDRWNTNEAQCGGPCNGPVEGISGWFHLAWDDDYLYIFCEITDNDFADNDELGFAINADGVRAEYGWESDPKSETPHAFVGMGYATYVENMDADGIAKHRHADIYWESDGNRWWFEARYAWDDVSLNPDYISTMWHNESFLFDIGFKNKYSDDNPPVGDKEYLQWSSDDNEFYRFSTKMGVVTLLMGTNVNNVQTKNLRISPNPANDKVNIRSSNVIGNASLFDITGRVVRNFNIPDMEYTFSTTGFEKGIYFLRLDSDNKAHKIIIK